MKSKLITLLAVALVLGACGAADDAGSTTTTSTPTIGGPGTTTTTEGPSTTEDRSPDEVVLQVRFEGGFAPVEMIYNPLPRYTLLGDGRIAFEGPTPAIFPGPLLPNVEVARLAEGDVARILELVAAAGLPDITEELNTEYADRVADAQNTVVTYHDGAGEHVFSVYALGIRLDPPKDPRVAALQRLVEALDAAAASVTDPEPWDVDALQIIVTDSFGGENEPEAAVVPWPLAAPVAELAQPVFGDVRCIALDGEQALTAAAAFEEASQLTFFDDGAGIYRLLVRPILPGETACPAS
jgi:hypothetical protein